MFEKLKQIIKQWKCRHRMDVVRWHWVHFPDYEPLSVEVISECVIPVTNLDSNDLLYKLNEIQQGISTETTFNGIQLNDKQKELVVDGIDVLKQLVNSGI